MSTTATTTSSTVPAARAVRVIEHDSNHGFCMVCGAVWPCSRARRDQMRAGVADVY